MSLNEKEDSLSSAPPSTPRRPRCVCSGKKSLYIFVPKFDITAFELAESMELLLLGVTPEMRDVLWDGMSDGVKRNWDVRELPLVSGVRAPKELLFPRFGRR